MKKITSWLIAITLAFLVGIGSAFLYVNLSKAKPVEPEEKINFIEIRITRHFAGLYGMETLVLKQIGTEWQAALLRNSIFDNCPVAENLQPKSGWNELWQNLQKENLLEIPDGLKQDSGWNDGYEDRVEVFYQGKFKRYSFHIAEKIDTKEARQMMNITNLISREFDTPMFKNDPTTAELEKFMANCREGKR